MYLKIQIAQLVISVCALATLYWSMQVETECYNVDTIVSDELIQKYKDL
jgi:hypothetical protein